MPMDIDRESLIIAAQEASARAYAPYSRFHVGAALAFDDGTVITAANVENASYGLSLCAETVAVSQAMALGWRGQLVAVAVVGGTPDDGGVAIPGAAPVTPCGRCRQVLNELAALGGTDPVIHCVGAEEVLDLRLSDLLPRAFGPANLG
ncbi:cytidine deaminase [Novosphingobium sp. FSY-8]|uniref:Cytidine deaminase n=1 Tax=Novosphingobium ovatum TaxID=1908523 RepID=A0ABW9XDS4_9SPHN|nr:cytidine deaminase [Novosphingobium ovatum]NBC36693.1 cytidine deaminase [Novosphingobium ovatum]